MCRRKENVLAALNLLKPEIKTVHGLASDAVIGIEDLRVRQGDETWEYKWQCIADEGPHGDWSDAYKPLALRLEPLVRRVLNDVGPKAFPELRDKRARSHWLDSHQLPATQPPPNPNDYGQV